MLLAAGVLLQSPKVQTALARKLARSLNEKIDGELTIGRVQILPFRTLILRDVVLTDDNPLTTSFFEPRDTIARIGMATVTFSLKDLTGSKPITLNKVVVWDGRLNLVTEGYLKQNLKRVIHGKEPKPLQDNDEILLIKKVEARNFRFTLANAMGKKTRAGSPGINWADMDLTADAKAHDFHIVDGTVRGVLDAASAHEKSGYRFHRAKGQVVVSRGKVQVRNFVLDDDESHLDIPAYSMEFENYLSFLHFTDEVTLDAQLRNSHLTGKTLSGFTGVAMPPFHMDISKAHFRGTVNDFDLDTFDFRERGGISGSLSGSVIGVTHPADARIDARLKGLSFTTDAVGGLLDAVQPGLRKTLSAFAPGQTLVLDADVSGPADDLSLNCGLAAPDGGTFQATVRARDLPDGTKPTQLSASLSTNDLDIGRIVGTDLVRACTLRTRLNASLGKGGISLDIDSLRIDKARINGYDYSGISAAGTYRDSAFDGRIACSDPNLDFLYQGRLNLSDKSGSAPSDFHFDLGYADLYALNLDKRGPSKASLVLDARFSRAGKDNIIGDLDIRDLKLENAEGVHEIGSLSLSSTASGDKDRLGFHSDFAEVRYDGTQPIPRLIADLRDLVLFKELPVLAKKAPAPRDPEEFSLSLKTADTRDLLSFILPGLYVAEGTTLDLHLDKDGAFKSSLSSQRIALKDKYIKDISIQAEDKGDKLVCDILGDELNAGVRLLGNIIRVTADNNRVDLLYLFDNQSDPETKGTLGLVCDLSRDADQALNYDIRTSPSDITVGGQKWTVDPSDIFIRPSQVKIPRFHAHNGEQRIEVGGGFAKNATDTLILSLNDLDLEPLRQLAETLPDICGKVTGQARLISPVTKDKLDLNASLTAREMAISGFDAGTLRIRGEWDNEHGEMDFQVKDEVRDRNTLMAAGSFQPSSRELRAKIKLDSLQVGYASGFLKEVFSEMEGKASGEIAVSGPLDRLSISSRGTRLDDALLRVAFTNVPYYVSGPFHIDDHGIYFDDMPLRDRFNGTGTVSGGIPFDHLRNIRMNASIRVNGVEAFNTDDDGESPVYGHVAASGTVKLGGPFTSLLMEINARTQGQGDFHIPLRSGNTLTGTDLLTFKQAPKQGWVDPYEEMMKSMSRKEKSKGHFAMKMRVGVGPDVQCDLEIDKENGNVLTGRGNGTINLDVGGAKAFAINGDYNLTAGDFHLNVMNIASKNFTIDSGSSIKFNGDIMESDMDITARYMTKTSLANLIADSTATSYRRTVICGLKVYDKLRNPQLEFSIDIPDLDPSSKSQVESALNTVDKVQKQFVALLVTNSFLPTDQSGVFNNTSDILMSNMMEVMSGQLSNILQRLQIPLDLGLKYAPGEGGNDLFDVAVSTKLFNDRVSVNGVIGNRQYAPDGSNQDVVGDLDVEIKLDNAGQVRLNLFSHSADKYSNYLDYSQRNGVGISYQREFNTFRGLVRSLFTSKKRRQEAAAQATSRQEEKKTLKIEADER